MLRTGIRPLLSRTSPIIVIVGAALASTAALAEPLNYAPPLHQLHRAIEQILPESLTAADREDAAGMSSQLQRRVVDYRTKEAPGTIVVDTPNTYLYLVLVNGRAIRYAIGVGRMGFTWSGVKTVERKAEWPDWVPPTGMLERQPYLPRFMAGGHGNPLGARALYIAGTVYRIHGTNDPSSIGKRVSSGCIRMLNNDVVDLYGRVTIGTRVVVLPTRPAQAPNLAGQVRSNASFAQLTTRESGRAHRRH